MKKLILFLTFFLFFLSPRAYSSGIDSLNVDDQFVSVGETWYTGYFTNYSVYTNRSFFKDENGGLHMVFISNYKLFYYFSPDDGQNWTEDQIITGYEGGIRRAVICADSEGNPYIGFSTNPYYNYANPTNVSYGHEFHYNTYFLYKSEGFWNSEEVYLSHSELGFSENYGFTLSEIYTMENGDIAILGYYDGWYNYGGAIWEFTRNSEGIWSDENIIYEYNDTPVDHGLVNVNAVLKDDGVRDLIYSRPYNSSGIGEIATIHFDGSNWGIPIQLTTNIHNYGAYDITTNSDGDVWLAYFTNVPEPQVNMFAGLESSSQLAIDLSLVDTIQTIKIHYSAGDLLDLIVYPFNNDTAVLYVSEDFGETWGDPMYVDRFIFNGVLPICDQYSNQLSDLEFMRIVRVSTISPFGPDSLFYTHVEQINTTSLGIAQFEGYKDKLQVYPNPVSAILNIHYLLNEACELNLKIYNLQGKVVLSRNYIGIPGENEIKLNVEMLDAGSYILEIYEKGYPPDDLHKASRKIVKLPAN